MSHTLPLAGVQVVDLTTFLSGPSATQLLGDLGADVIKVEAPTGDSSRTIPPHFVDGESAYFLANNRNKRSIVLDLKQPAGVDVARGLIERADVVIENFRPGVCARLGLDPAKLTAAHPELVWASISGFGQQGPDRNRPAYDMVVQALSGAMSLTGHPGGPSARLGIPAGDVIAGMYAVIGVLAALLARERTGAGRVIDVAMVDSMLAQLSYQAVYAAVSGVAPGRQGAGHDSIPTYRTFQGGDGEEFVVTANTQRMWTALCTVLGRPDLPEDPRFLDEALRLGNRDALWVELERTFATNTAQAWIARLVAAGVPTAPVLDVPAALDNARAADRASVIHLGPSDAGFDAVDTPIVFVDTDASPRRYPPQLGEQTDQILAELGLDEPARRELHRLGAVLSAPTEKGVIS